MDLENRKQILVAMKGHPGSGKSTIARSIATALNSPLLDKDDVRNSTHSLSLCGLHQRLLNDLSYQVLWQIASTQLHLGLNVVIDSPLSRKSHFDRLVQLANPPSPPDSDSCSSRNISSGQLERSGGEPSPRKNCPGAWLVIVECRPKDGAEWRRRVEERGAEGENWHKPATWRDIEKLLDEYDGCYEYDVGDVPKLVLDTTAEGVGVEEHVSSVLNFIHSSHGQ